MKAKNVETNSFSPAATKGAATSNPAGFWLIPCCFREDMFVGTELDYGPPYHASIGFARVSNLVNNMQCLQMIDSLPSYDIVKVGDNEDPMSMALVGFSSDERRLKHVPSGAKTGNEGGQYLYSRHHRPVVRTPIRDRRRCKSRCNWSTR